MQCPTDGTTLVMSERSGIEIDYCPECRGVWLDRGELDKIIDRGMQMSAPQAPPPQAPPQQAPQQQRYEQPRYDDRRYDDRGSYKRKKKEHWLSELFD
ncbi:TFIIB-type zinc ribbon-containing protein [Solicola gregarius]|uniref:Zf-TFIIB domain-containing protein n=1 Tax=Solicola gregarius TaxID=2908642 RepID=A0AA46YN61_9ACTN|nr:zf-TFIIB domain-containing protein [Solicola gregarius]UYM07274.1 zf-TFIIB domain-containing protein [Solicola gregarius]